VSASFADPVPPPGRFLSDGLAANTELSVRQGGGADQEGLLSKIKGQGRGNVAGTSQLPILRGAELNFNYAGDKHDGLAVESRLSKTFNTVRLTGSSTLNRGFESDWTGSGASRASQIDEGWFHWSLSATTYGSGLRETFHADGSRSTDLRTLQKTPLGSGTLTNSTVMRLDGHGADHTSGSLIYYGPLSSFQLTGEIDHSDLRPTMALLDIKKSIDRSCSLYLVAEQSLDTKQGSIDIGASRETGGFIASVYGGATESGSAYMGLRFSIALAPAARQDRRVVLR
jgi:hypothetical protein